MWKSYKAGLSGETYEKQIAHFKKWEQHIEQTGLQDVWLRSLSTADKNFIIAGFAQEIRENNYSKTKVKKKLMADTVAATISSVSSTFRENGFCNPTLDEDNQRSIFLKRQLRGFKREDPLPQGQQCLPLSFFKSLYEDKSSTLNIALGQLISGALFFACRCCEYSRVSNDEKRKTKTLTLENLKFFKNFIEIQDINKIHQGDFIQITFISQKNRNKTSINNSTQEFLHFLPCQDLGKPETKNFIISQNINQIQSKHFLIEEQTSRNHINRNKTPFKETYTIH